MRSLEIETEIPEIDVDQNVPVTHTSPVALFRDPDLDRVRGLVIKRKIQDAMEIESYGK
jgi:hypothetical protein